MPAHRRARHSPLSRLMALLTPLALGGAAFAVLAAAPLRAHAATPASTQVQAACAGPMKLSPADTAFQACAFSLADSLNRREAQAGNGVTGSGNRGDESGTAGQVAALSYYHQRYSPHPSHRTRRENAACRAVGFVPHQPDFATCVANLHTAMVRADMLVN